MEPLAEKAWTVSELTARIKGTLEPSFVSVWVRGEVSNHRPAGPSGHLYFSIKDAGASVSAAFFGWSGRGRRGPPRFELEDGLEVIAHGRISVYAPRGNYQLLVDDVQPVGEGALALAFEQLKQKLAAEGLFAPERKRALPKLVESIAIVTSATGAALRDMIHVLGRRAPQVKITIVPAQVQGDGAAEQIRAALAQANELEDVQVVVLARGGGSIEDLWCFNDERLARAIAESSKPVVSAVGHEVDFTIADFVADVRAATPSAAAELLSSDWAEVRRGVVELAHRLLGATRRDLGVRQQVFAQLAQRLKSPRDRLLEQSQRCDELGGRLERAVRRRLERSRAELDRQVGSLDALSPLRVLSRGYSILRTLEGVGPSARGSAVISSRAALVALGPGRRLRVTFGDGDATLETR